MAEYWTNYLAIWSHWIAKWNSNPTSWLETLIRRCTSINFIHIFFLKWGRGTLKKGHFRFWKYMKSRNSFESFDFWFCISLVFWALDKGNTFCHKILSRIHWIIFSADILHVLRLFVIHSDGIRFPTFRAEKVNEAALCFHLNGCDRFVPLLPEARWRPWRRLWREWIVEWGYRWGQRARSFSESQVRRRAKSVHRNQGANVPGKILWQKGRVAVLMID